MADSVNREQRKKKHWQEHKARKKLARLSSECRDNTDASAFEPRDIKVPATAIKIDYTKEPTAKAKVRPTSKEPTRMVEDYQTPKRRLDGDNCTDRTRKKRRRRGLINRAERDKSLARLPVGKQNPREKGLSVKSLLREVCI